MDDAKKAGRAGKQGPWSQYPQRMRQMRARAWAMRDGFADVLKGIGIAEEVRDFPVVEGGEVQAQPLTRAMLQQQAEEVDAGPADKGVRSEEHTSELQSLMRNSYAVFCLKKK